MKKISKLARRIIGMALSFAVAVTVCVVPVTVFAADVPSVYILGDSTGCDYAESQDPNYYYKPRNERRPLT